MMEATWAWVVDEFVLLDWPEVQNVSMLQRKDKAQLT